MYGCGESSFIWGYVLRNSKNLKSFFSKLAYNVPVIFPLFTVDNLQPQEIKWFTLHHLSTGEHLEVGKKVHQHPKKKLSFEEIITRIVNTNGCEICVIIKKFLCLFLFLGAGAPLGLTIIVTCQGHKKVSTSNNLLSFASTSILILVTCYL